jgi:hypothetical protein
MHVMPIDRQPAFDVERATEVVSRLDGQLDEATLASIQGTWSVLEHAATSTVAHARAVRSRLFWESLSAHGSAAAPGASLRDFNASREYRDAA